MKKEKLKIITGRIAITLSLIITSAWSFWGAIENFHEGWYFDSLLKNIGLMLIQYASPVLLFVLLTLLSIRKNKLGAVLFIVLGIIIYTKVNIRNLFFLTPFFVFAFLFWFGTVKNKKRAYRLLIFIPLAIFTVFSIEPAIRVAGRVNDGNFGMRTIEGNGVTLEWAPAGPGFPERGTDWYEAMRICSHLSEDGTQIMDSVQNIWRLPTVEEVVRSMTKHNKNCGGRLDPETGEPVYEITPDKETPLWNPNSMVIYWWTSTEVDSTKAYIIVYDGKIWPKYKNNGPAYRGFRAVRD